VPARPGCATPHLRFLFFTPSFASDLLQTPPGGNAPGSGPGKALALSLPFGSATIWRADFHLPGFVPCPAHTGELTCLA
jgi:hypothetical protein